MRHHHERLDGRLPGWSDGRPDPLIARIIAVADVYDALTSARPYRGASAMQEALDIIDWEAGTKLDAECVAALHRVAAGSGGESRDH